MWQACTDSHKNNVNLAETCHGEARVKDCIVHILFTPPKPVDCPLLFPLPSHCDPNCHPFMRVCDGFTVYEWARESGLKKEKPWSKAPFTAFFNSLISWLVRSEWECFFHEEGGKSRRLEQPGGEERGKTRGKGIFTTVPSSSPNPALLRNSLAFSFESVKGPVQWRRPFGKGVWSAAGGPSVSDI